MAPILPGNVTGAWKKRVILVTYGEMGSPPCAKRDIPEEESADIDKGKTSLHEEGEPDERGKTIEHEDAPDEDVKTPGGEETYVEQENVRVEAEMKSERGANSRNLLFSSSSACSA